MPVELAKLGQRLLAKGDIDWVEEPALINSVEQSEGIGETQGLIPTNQGFHPKKFTLMDMVDRLQRKIELIEVGLPLFPKRMIGWIRGRGSRSFHRGAMAQGNSKQKKRTGLGFEPRPARLGRSV